MLSTQASRRVRTGLVPGGEGFWRVGGMMQSLLNTWMYLGRLCPGCAMTYGVHSGGSHLGGKALNVSVVLCMCVYVCRTRSA